MNVYKYIELELLRLPSLRCVKYSWKLNAISDLWISLLATVLVPCFIYIYYLVRKCMFHRTCRIRHEFLQKTTSCKKACFRATMIFLFSTYPITSKRVLQLLPFTCHNICYDSAMKQCISFIKADYGLKSLPSDSKYWLLYAVYVCILIPVGFPLLLLVYLFRIFRVKKQKRLYIEMNADEYGYDMLGTDKVGTLLTNNETDTSDKEHFAMKFLYKNYKPSYWYWEVIEMYHKLLLSSVLPKFASQSRVVLGIGIVFSSFFTVLYAYMKPLKDSFEHCL